MVRAPFRILFADQWGRFARTFLKLGI